MIETRINRIVDNEWIINKDFSPDFCLDNTGGHAYFCGPLDSYNVLLVKVLDKDNVDYVIEKIRDMKDLPREYTGEIHVESLKKYLTMD